MDGFFRCNYSMENIDKNVKLIARFLRSKKVLEKFCYNTAKYQKIDVDNSLCPKEKVIKIISKALDNFCLINPTWDERLILQEFIIDIDSSFLWSDTIEGEEFWKDINNEWTIFLKGEGIIVGSQYRFS